MTRVEPASAGGSSPSAFTPIAAFNRTDADVSLIFLVNRAEYLGPVDDLWYRATQAVPLLDDASAYVTDHLLDVMGCTEQYQICNPLLPEATGCTPLVGLGQLSSSPSLQNLKLNDPQRTLVHHFSTLLSLSTLDNLIANLGSSSLLAQNSVSSSTHISTALPHDQWKAEVINWHQTMRATFQQSIVDYAAGPLFRGWEQWIQRPPSNGTERDLCSAQIVRNTAYMSFSVLGLSIIFVIGGLLIILNLILPTIVSEVRNRKSRGLHIYDEWLSDNPLHLQQRAFEETGRGTWLGKDQPVPVTGRDEKFRSMAYGIDTESFSLRPTRKDDFQSSSEASLKAFGQDGMTGTTSSSVPLLQLPEQQPLMPLQSESQSFRIPRKSVAAPISGTTSHFPS
jgi:hypothetical protein